MPKDRVQLGDWRRAVAEIYAAIRQLDPERGWSTFRRERDFLIKTHAQSPLSEPQRERFEKPEDFPYDSQWRLTVPLEPPSSQS
ncbi:MAG: hypothetical protein O6949_05740 [Chloroflexi bacterium]|nr:hypothetical protein [Chloroflexota bacterium]